MSSRFLTSTTIFLLTAAGLAAAPRSDLLPPERRAPAVELASRLAEPGDLPPLASEPVPPFRWIDPERPHEPAASGVPRTTPRDVLIGIASRIEPSGTIILGGEPILLFGQKKLKVGDKLTVTYQGSDYELDITAIERTTYKLRLNGEEITRPIKPGKTP